MNTKFDILDKVFWLNTAERRFDCGQVRGIQAVPTGMHKDAEGNDVLDGVAVLYQLEGGRAVFESEAFKTEEQARESYRDLFRV